MTGVNDIAPTGTVGVDDGNGGSCTTPDLSDNGDGTSSASCAIVEKASDSPYSVTATYGGDTNYSGNTDNISQTVDPAGPAVAITGTTPSPAKSGSVTYHVTVTGVNDIAPTGTVGVDDGNGGSCTTPDLSDNGDGTSSASCAIVEKASDSPYSVTATYGGDTNYSGNTDNISQTVDPAGPAVAITGTTLQSGEERQRHVPRHGDRSE